MISFSLIKKVQQGSIFPQHSQTSSTGNASEETETGEKRPETPAEKIPCRASSQIMNRIRSLQVQSYLSKAQMPRSEQALVFWRTNKSCFPVLAEVAWAHLSAPYTSVCGWVCVCMCVCMRVDRERLSSPVCTLHKCVCVDSEHLSSPVCTLHECMCVCVCVCVWVDREHLFSSTSHVVDEKGNRLACGKAEMLLFVKMNLHTLLNRER